MQYRVTTEDGHSLTIAPGSNEDTFEACQLKVDLSQATLITDPAKESDTLERHGELLHPLGMRSRYAFELLTELDPEVISRSPFLKALIAFKERRLPELLEEISKEAPTPTIDPGAIDELARQPRRVEKLLGRIVKELDAQLPGYFGVEKATGVWEWLKSGGAQSVVYSVGSEMSLPLPVTKEHQHVLTDVSGERVLFDLRTQTAHIGGGSNPTVRTVLSSLCTTGTLGREVVDLNRAALFDVTTSTLQRHIRASEKRDPAAHMQKQLTNQVSSHLHTRLATCVAGVSFACSVGALILLHVLRGSVNGFDVALGALATFVGQRTAHLARQYRSAKRAISHLATEAAKSLEGLKEFGGIHVLRIFQTAIIDHVVNQSGGRHHTVFGERTEMDWRAVLPRVAKHDTNVLRSQRISVTPHIEVECPEPLQLKCTEEDDFSGLSCDLDEIAALATPEFLRAAHIERAAAVWNISHALGLLRDFTETQGIPIPPDSWFDPIEALRNHTGGRLDERGSYPEISGAFARVTGHFKITRSTWDRISMALQAASTLEGLSQTRRAQALTIEAIRKELL